MEREAGSGAQPRRYFLKCVFSLSPGLAGRSRLCFWTPLTEISLLVKFQPDRAPPAQDPETPPRRRFFSKISHFVIF